MYNKRGVGQDNQDNHDNNNNHDNQHNKAVDSIFLKNPFFFSSKIQYSGFDFFYMNVNVVFIEKSYL